MKIEFRNIHDIKPYKNNPRNNDKAVNQVIQSIKEYGFKNPIIIDENNEILAGHTRYKASIQLGMTNIPTIQITDLTEEQKKGYRIADNRTTEFATWDYDLLKIELEDINIFTGFDINELETSIDNQEDINNYSQKIKIPKYEPKQEKPDINKLFNKQKYDDYIKKIDSINFNSELKDFLKLASTRFIVFDYHNIAEYYAHSSKDIQMIFEELALVIIDFNKSIELGFVEFTNQFYEEVLEDD